MQTERREGARRGGLLPAALALVMVAAPGVLASAPAFAQDEMVSGAAPEKEVTLKIRSSGELADPLAAVRDRLHLTVAHVPAFPLKDKRYLRPSGWPEHTTIAGVKLKRRIQAWDEYIGENLKSLRDVRPRMRVVLSYENPGTGMSAGWGPRYTWDARRRLTERIWYEPDQKRLITHDYTYYSDGRLLGYSWRSGPRDYTSDAPTEFISEFYDRSGDLVAVGYEKKVGEETVSAYVWDGHLVPFDDFRMKSHVLYASSVNPR